MKPFSGTDAVYWIVTFKIHPGQEAAFHAIREKLIASTREEPGALNYEWSLGEDGLTCQIYERYADSAAARLHLARSGELVGQLVAVVTRESFLVYGAPDEQTRQMLGSRGAIFLKPVGGFGR